MLTLPGNLGKEYFVGTQKSFTGYCHVIRNFGNCVDRSAAGPDVRHG